MPHRFRLLLPLGLLIFSNTVLASEIKLTSGVQITGEIVERDSESIRVKTPADLVVTYYLDEISTIDGEPAAPAVKSEPVLVEQLPPEKIAEMNREATVASTLSTVTQAASSITGKLQSAIDTTQGERNQFSANLESDATQMKAQMETRMAKSREALGRMATSINSRIQARREKPLSTFEVILMVVSFAVTSFALMKLAKKFLISYAWIAWIPGIQLLLVFRMARQPFWWVIFLIVPLVNIFIFLKLWIDIFRAFDRSAWLSLGMLVPIVNIILLWWLATMKGNPVAVSAPKPSESLFEQYIRAKKSGAIRTPRAAVKKQYFMQKPKNSRY